MKLKKGEEVFANCLLVGTEVGLGAHELKVDMTVRVFKAFLAKRSFFTDDPHEFRLYLGKRSADAGDLFRVCDDEVDELDRIDFYQEVVVRFTRPDNEMQNEERQHEKRRRRRH